MPLDTAALRPGPANDVTRSLGRSPTSLHAAALGTTLMLAVGALACVLAGAGSARWMLMAAALGACAAVTWPLAVPGARLVSSWSVAVATIYLTVGVRTAYIVTNHPDAATIERLYTLGVPLDEMITPGLWVVAFLLLLSIGYTIAHTAGRGRSPWRPAVLRVSHQQAMALTVALAIVGLLSLLMFVVESGGLTLVSAKRNLIANALVGGDTTYQSFGHWRFLNRSSQVAVMLYLVWQGSRGFRPRHWIVLAMLYLLAIALPFYANSRTQITWLTLGIAAYFLIKHRRIRLRPLAIGIVIALAMFQLLTTFRSNRAAEVSNVVTLLADANPLDSVVLTRNLVSLPRTAHIWHALEAGELEHEWGSTMISWLYGWIPRAVWSGKPVANPGPEIGRVIYGFERGGAPPGLPAESFWNFGFGAGLVVAVPAGLLLGHLDSRLRPDRRTGSESQLMLYLLVALPFAARIIGDSVTQGVIDAAADTTIAVGALWLVTWVLPDTSTKTNAA